MRRPLVAGNWKMNGSKASVAVLIERLIQGCEQVEEAELSVFPPFVFLAQCEQSLMRTQISWGAQEVSSAESGAYTGQVSTAMLLDFHCRYVIVGHSERRLLCSETNEVIAAKLKAVLKLGMRPILCVGETERQRMTGETLSVISEQLAAVLHLPDNLPRKDLVIAYEPVWAIGSGRSASPEQAQEIHAAIRKNLRSHEASLADSVRILYGGSVKPDNAADLFTMPDIDGALVGGASLHAEQFIEIAKQCKK